MLKTNMWLPPSYHRDESAVRRAVKDYDPNLDFGKNEETGQWCVFLKQGRSEAARGGDLPIMGFQTVPSPTEAVDRLKKADALRRGREILDDLNRHNETLKKRIADEADDASRETAEAFDWGFRKMGKSPYTKVFF